MTASSEDVPAVDHPPPVRTPIDRIPSALLRFAGGNGPVEVLEANQRAAALLATKAEELVGTGLVLGLSADEATRVATVLHDPDQAPAEVVLHRGITSPVQVLGIEVQRDVDGTVLAALTDRTVQHRPTQIGRPVTPPVTTADDHSCDDAIRTRQELWRLANRDPLTGLPNRTSCYDRLDQALARTRREARPTAVLFCEVNRLRQVNDRVGHAAGDTLLVRIAERFAASVRETDTVCRFGGDEFVVISEGFDDLAGIEALTRRLIDLTRTTVELVDDTAIVGLSVGIAIARAGSTRDQLLSSAEAARRRAKRNGPNTYVVADHQS